MLQGSLWADQLLTLQNFAVRERSEIGTLAGIGTRWAEGVWVEVIVTGLVAGAAALAVCAKLWQLCGGRETPWRHYIEPGVVVLTPGVIAVLSLVKTLSLRAWCAAALLQTFYEAAAVWCLLRLILGWLGSTTKDVMMVLEEADPQRLWAAVPLCCCALLPGTAPRTADFWDVAVVKALVLQYIAVSLVLDLLELFQQAHGDELPLAIGLSVRVPSEVGLIYGFQVLLAAARRPLAGRRGHAKFWLLEGLLVLELLGRLLVPRRGWLSGHARAAACMLAASLALPFSLAQRLVYSVDDLDPPRPQSSQSLPHQQLQ